ncbi:hypothetical protein X740_31730 [Mesorhizobium sp. LNHC221B00]|nr:hypothetical protein X740_31730 [Mesorhizobium sp. LNHC221B00]
MVFAPVDSQIFSRYAGVKVTMFLEIKAIHQAHSNF